MKKRATEKAEDFCDKSLMYWAVKGKAGQQILLVILVILIVIARVIPLEMQKRIINESIALRQYNNLYLYCLIYLVAIFFSNALKFWINTLQTFIGERAMSAMRSSLYHHIISLPLSFFRKTQPGFVVSSLMAELSTIGVFAGMAIAVPLTNILTLIAFAAYLLWLNTTLALATLSIYPIVIFVLPKLQKMANVANKDRIDLSRRASSKIAESISGIGEIHAHGAFQEEDKKFQYLIDLLQKIRIRWALLRHGIKTTNNFFVSLGPFIVFTLGGYLVLEGELELGGMVAFLSAQEKLYDPWKELIDFYQLYQDAIVRYKKTTDHFNISPEVEFSLPAAGSTKLEGTLNVSGLYYSSNDGHLLLKNISFSLAQGEHLALIGFSGSGKSTLAKCIGNLYSYKKGSIKIGGHEIKELTKSDIVNNIGFVSQSPFIFTGTIEENLTYAFMAKHPADNRPSITLDDKIEALQNAGFFIDVLRFGLDTVLSSKDEELKEKAIRMRKCFFDKYGKKLAPLIDFYDEKKYDPDLTILDNILLDADEILRLQYGSTPLHPDLVALLHSSGLHQHLVSLGYLLARQSFTDTDMEDANIPFSHQPGMEGRPAQTHATGNAKMIHSQTDEPRRLGILLENALQYISRTDQANVLPIEITTKIVACRRKVAAFSQDKEGSQTGYSREEYLHNDPIINNIFFGRISSQKMEDQEKINQAIIQLLIEEDCLEAVAQLGLLYNVGSEGIRLSGGQRQKLSIARVILKRSNFLILDEATSALDNKSQMRIERLRITKWQGRCTVVAIVHRLDLIQTYDKIAVMKEGRLVEFGPYKELIAQQGFLKQLARKIKPNDMPE